MKKLIFLFLFVSSTISLLSQNNEIVVDELNCYPHICFHVFGNENPKFEIDTTFWMKNNLVSTFKVDSNYYKVAFNLGADTMTYSIIHICSYVNDSAWIDPFKLDIDNRIFGCKYSWHTTVTPTPYLNHYIHFKLK